MEQNRNPPKKVQSGKLVGFLTMPQITQEEEKYMETKVKSEPGESDENLSREERS